MGPTSKSRGEAPVKPLRPYMCWCGEPEEGAVLAWAHTAQEARKLAYPVISDWGCESFIDVRARLLTLSQEYYETLKLEEGPHVNDRPPCCPNCDLWGYPPLPDGNGCEFCKAIEDEHNNAVRELKSLLR